MNNIKLLYTLAAAIALIYVMPLLATEQERWVNLNDIGFEILGHTNSVKLTRSDALKLFSETQSHLAEDWRVTFRTLGHAVPTPAKLPKYVFPLTNAPFAKVVSFSPTQLRIMILQECGYYIWHHFYDCIASMNVQRCNPLDQLFGLQGLESTYGASYKGLQQGDSVKKVKEILGEPDAVETFQAMEFFRYSYFKDDVVITFFRGIRKIKHGVSPYVKKQVEKSGEKQIAR